MGQEIRREISDEVRCARVYAIMAEESKDISKVAQLSIALRYVIQGNVYERFIKYVTCILLGCSFPSKVYRGYLTFL